MAKDKGGGGAPKWMATFADLMSLLLAFFVLLFSFSNVDDKKYAKVGGSMAEAFGVQRRIDVNDPVTGVNFIATEFSSAPPDPNRLNVVPQENLDVDRAHEEVEKPETGGKDGLKGSGETETKEQKEQAIDIGKMLDSSSDVEGDENKKKNEVLSYVQEQLKEELLKGELDVEMDGDHVIISISEDSSFEKGSIAVKQPFKDLMQKISSALEGVHGEVLIGGHTDNEPIKTDRFRSNWELSAGRAVTVLEGLLNYTDIKPENFVVMGHGSTRPKADNSTAAGRAKNRRVDVKLRYDAIKIKREKIDQMKLEKSSEEFEKSIEELGKSSPISPGNETVYDIIMQGFR